MKWRMSSSKIYPFSSLVKAPSTSRDLLASRLRLHLRLRVPCLASHRFVQLAGSTQRVASLVHRCQSARLTTSESGERVSHQALTPLTTSVQALLVVPSSSPRLAEGNWLRRFAFCCAGTAPHRERAKPSRTDWPAPALRRFDVCLDCC